MEHNIVEPRNRTAPGFRTGRQKRNNSFGLRFGTWNVRSLFTPGAFDKLLIEAKKYNLDLVALQEVRWVGEGSITKDGYKLIYGGTDKHFLGTAFLIRDKYCGNIKKNAFISDRLSYIRMRGSFNDLVIFNVHAPTEDSEDETKDTFYDTLEEIYNLSSNYETKLVLGDMNAKVGRESIFKPTIGDHSLHADTNDNGHRLIQFAISKNMFIKSTMYPHKNIHKATWVSPDLQTQNQIDHVLINERRQSSITDIRVYRGADLNSDHYLVIIKILQNITKHKKRERKIGPNLDALKIERKKQEYEDRVRDNLSEKRNNTDDASPKYEQKWNNIKESILEASKDLGPNEIKKKKWFDEECKLELEKRDQKRMRALTSPDEANREEYRIQRRETKKLLRRKKRQAEKESLEELEKYRRTNNSREFFQQLKRTQKGNRTQEETIKDKNGQILYESGEIVNRWKEYFQDLLNIVHQDNEEDTVIQTAEMEDIPPSRGEVANAIRKLKNNKAAGCDTIPSELIKKGGLKLEEEVTDLIQEIWKEEKMPSEWTKAVIIPIHKKGDKKECGNYRGISLLNTTYKILSLIILERLKPFTDEIVGDYQAGFKKNKSTTDQIFSLRQILEKRIEYGKETVILFVDFKKAYDCLIRRKIFDALLVLGIPKKLTQMVKACMQQTYNQVRVQSSESDVFETVSGVKQGDGLSPIIFNLALHHGLRKLSTKETLGITNFQILAYADDIAIMGVDKEDIERCLVELEEGTSELGLEINREKTQYMIITTEDKPKPSEVMLNNNKYKVVESFTYLGSQLNGKNIMEEEIKNRITKANRCYFSLNNIFRSKNVSQKSKIRIYQSVILPVLLYGCEVWSINKKTEQMLQTFENKILRRIYGPIRDENTGLFRIKKNREIWALYGEPLITSCVKGRIMRWAGHVARADEESIVKKVFNLDYGATEKRRRGRPRKRWRDNIKDWFISIKSQQEEGEEWTQTAQDRPRWRRLIRAGFGPSRPV
ncbi:hypothetical protein M8J77_006391 [Diaphorina citri]|nr:hypothetical protein M8J77_006391 [Diaphorina citri]